MYHNLPLHIGLAFSFAEGKNVAGIRDYPRLLKLAFSRKDFVKMKRRWVEGGVRITPCPFTDHHFILANIFCQGEGDSRDWGLPSTPLHRQPRRPKK